MRGWELVTAALLAASWTSALAERADRQKPIHVESDRMSADDLKQVAVFQGHVVVTQGTFTLCANQLTLRQDKAGNQSGTALGNPARFREKRDGVDEWIEGEGLRIEYDNTAEVVELFEKAKVNQNKDEASGEYISYDAKTEIYKVQTGKEQADGGPVTSQVHAVFNPKPKPAEGQTAPPPPHPAPALQPDATLSTDKPAAATSPNPAPMRPLFCR
jgi:lipopolysaccharide export system protein LptA